MKKKIAMFVALFILLVVWFAPVQIAEGFIPKSRIFSVTGLSGSIWSGKIDEINIKHLSLREIDYSVNFISLLTAKLGAHAEILKGDIKGDLSFEIADEKNMEISNANLKLSARVIEKYIPFPGIQLDGSLSTQDLSTKVVNKKPIALSGTTVWNNASVSFSGNHFELGKFQIQWQTNDEKKQIIGTIDKTQNAMSLEGVITISQSGIFDFNGSVSNKTDRAIYNTLLFFASGKESNGRLPIRYKKKLK